MWRFMMCADGPGTYRLYYSGVVIPPEMWLMAHSEKLEDLLEGKPVALLKMASWPGRNSITPT